MAPHHRVIRVPWSETFALTGMVGVDVEAARTRLGRLYGSGTRSWSRRGVTVFATGDHDHHADTSESLRCWSWGAPIGASGEASENEIVGALLGQPDLSGTWIIAGELDHSGFRCRTSANQVHTLKTLDTPGGPVWSTRSLAAHAVADLRPRLHEERIPERVLWDLVFDDDELLEGVRLFPDAGQLDIGADGNHRTSSWWALERRLFPDSSTTPGDLVEVLRQTMRPYERLPRIGLGLTAGQDSSLLAGVLHESCPSTVPDAFTIGLPDFPDVVGAAASASLLGWPHRTVGLDATAPAPSFERAMQRSVWTEGLDHGRNVAGAPLDLFPAPTLWLAGSGGEAARAFYWGDQPDDIDPVGAMLTDRRLHLTPSTTDLVEARLRTTVDAAYRVGKEGLEALDVVYLRNRMRSWLNRSVPPPQLAGVLMPYLEPPVVSTLLGLPRERRRSGEGFRSALRELRLDPLATARAAAGLASSLAPVRPPAGRTVRGFVGRGRRPWPRRRRRRAGDPHPELATLMTLFEASPTRGRLIQEALGERWFAAAVAAADRASVTQLWNGLAVEAFAAVLDGPLWDG